MPSATGALQNALIYIQQQPGDFWSAGQEIRMYIMYPDHVVRCAVRTGDYDLEQSRNDRAFLISPNLQE